MSLTNLIIFLNVVIMVFLEIIYQDSSMKNYIYQLYGMNFTNMDNPIVWITNMFLHAGFLHLIMNMIVWTMKNIVHGAGIIISIIYCNTCTSYH